jgi:hypothetical protein
MRYRKLTPEGDYSFGHGENDFYSGQTAAGQAIKTRLLLLLGEWWEDLEDGLPLFENIIGQREQSKQGADLVIQMRIAETPDVQAIKEYSSEIKSRQLFVHCVAETIYGDAVTEVIF